MRERLGGRESGGERENEREGGRGRERERVEEREREREEDRKRDLELKKCRLRRLNKFNHRQLSTYRKYSWVNQGREYWYMGSTSAKSAITKYRREALETKNIKEEEVEEEVTN